VVPSMFGVGTKRMCVRRLRTSAFAGNADIIGVIAAVVSRPVAGFDDLNGRTTAAGAFQYQACHSKCSLPFVLPGQKLDLGVV